ncbi:MAG: helix-turn-helix transcriptional regulator [Lentisphaeria bacterium]|nr:helix-turn-helix transcriptional regulator [Lentisphaeria bacterium]
MKILKTPYRRDPPRAKTYTSAGRRIEMEDSRQRSCEKIFRPGEPYFLLACTSYFHTIAQPGDWRRRIGTDYLAVTLVLAGETAVRIDDASFIAEKDELIFLPPGSDYETGTLTESERSALILRGSALESLLRGMDLKRTFPAPPGSDLREIYDRLYALLKEPSENQPGLVSRLSFSLIDLASSLTGKETMPENLRDLLSWIARNLNHPQNAAGLADRIHVSTATLNRIFRKYLNTSPRKYLITLRMETALRMMKEPDFRVKEIAAAVGCPDPANFSTVFRKFHGFSPGKMRSGR